MIKQQFAATCTPERVAYRLTDVDVQDMIAGFLAAKCEPTSGRLSLSIDGPPGARKATIWREVEP